MNLKRQPAAGYLSLAQRNKEKQVAWLCLVTTKELPSLTNAVFPKMLEDFQVKATYRVT